VILEPNRHLVFTTRTGTDLRIIPWISLRITMVSGPEWIQIQISCNGSESHQTNLKRCTTQPNTFDDIQTYTYTLYTYLHMDTHTCTNIYTYTHTHTHMQIPKY